MLDRTPERADRSAAESRPIRLDGRAEDLRLALAVDDCMVLVGRDDDDGLYLAISNAMGGGACKSARWVLREKGAIVMTQSGGRRVFVFGIVADEVIAVRVGDVPARMGENVFLAEIGRDDSPVPVITTTRGDREVAREDVA